MDREFKPRSSLKSGKAINKDEDNTETRLARRISFSSKKHIREYQIGNDATQFQNSYDISEHSNNSENSGVANTRITSKSPISTPATQKSTVIQDLTVLTQQQSPRPFLMNEVEDYTLLQSERIEFLAKSNDSIFQYSADRERFRNALRENVPFEKNSILDENNTTEFTTKRPVQKATSSNTKIFNESIISEEKNITETEVNAKRKTTWEKQMDITVNQAEISGNLQSVNLAEANSFMDLTGLSTKVSYEHSVPMDSKPNTPLTEEINYLAKAINTAGRKLEEDKKSISSSLLEDNIDSSSNLRQLNNDLESGRLKVFSGPATPSTERKPLRFWPHKEFQPRSLKNLDEEPETSLLPIKNLDKTKYRYSQADEAMLNSTNFLAKARLGDETQSRNSTKMSIKMDTSQNEENELDISTKSLEKQQQFQQVSELHTAVGFSSRGYPLLAERPNTATSMHSTEESLQQQQQQQRQQQQVSDIDISMDTTTESVPNVENIIKANTRKTLYFENIDIDTTQIIKADLQRAPRLNDSIPTEEKCADLHALRRSIFQTPTMDRKRRERIAKLQMLTPGRSLIEFEDFENEVAAVNAVNDESTSISITEMVDKTKQQQQARKTIIACEDMETDTKDLLQKARFTNYNAVEIEEEEEAENVEIKKNASRLAIEKNKKEMNNEPKKHCFSIEAAQYAGGALDLPQRILVETKYVVEPTTENETNQMERISKKEHKRRNTDYQLLDMEIDQVAAIDEKPSFDFAVPAARLRRKSKQGPLAYSAHRAAGVKTNTKRIEEQPIKYENDNNTNTDTDIDRVKYDVQMLTEDVKSEVFANPKCKSNFINPELQVYVQLDESMKELNMREMSEQKAPLAHHDVSFETENSIEKATKNIEIGLEAETETEAELVPNMQNTNVMEELAKTEYDIKVSLEKANQQRLRKFESFENVQNNALPIALAQNKHVEITTPKFCNQLKRLSIELTPNLPNAKKRNPLRFIDAEVTTGNIEACHSVSQHETADNTTLPYYFEAQEAQTLYEQSIPVPRVFTITEAVQQKSTLKYEMHVDEILNKSTSFNEMVNAANTSQGSRDSDNIAKITKSCLNALHETILPSVDYTGNDIENTYLSLVGTFEDTQEESSCCAYGNNSNNDKVNEKVELERIKQTPPSTFCGKKCPRCMITINESYNGDFSLLEKNFKPDLGLSELRKLRKTPTIDEYLASSQQQSEENTRQLGNSFVKKDQKKFDINGLVERYRRALQSKLKMPPLVPKFQAPESFVSRLEILLKDNPLQWIFDFQAQIRGIYIFSHTKVTLHSLEVRFEQLDQFVENIKIKSVEFFKERRPIKNWSPINYVMDFQLQLKLYFDLATLLHDNDSEQSVYELLKTIDGIIMECQKTVDRLYLLVVKKRAKLIRNENGIFVEKIVTTAIPSVNAHVAFKEERFSILIQDVHAISHKNINWPRQDCLRDIVKELPIGLDFLSEFLEKPQHYLKANNDVT